MTRPTRDEVALKAGVSTATVSRAYNNPEQVAEDKLLRIRQAAAELGYVPDLHASALRRKGTGTIVLLMPPGGDSRADDSRMYDFIFSDGVRGVLKAMENTLYSVRVATVTTMTDVRRYINPSVCDGVILGNGAIWQWPVWLKESPVPLVVCSQTPQLKALCMIYLDEEAGGRGAGLALKEAGRKSPAHISGRLQELVVCKQRAQGFASVFPGPFPVIDGELGIQGGYKSALQLIPEITADRIDSIFVVNDLTAIGVMQALQEHKIAVPGQVAIIAYDNLSVLRTLPIPLATMDLNMDLIHAKAAELLIKKIQGQSEGVMRIPVAPSFVPGQSLEMH